MNGVYIDFDKDIVSLAMRRRAAMPVKLRNSQTQGQGTLVGLVGEYCAASLLRSKGIPAEIRDAFDYDIVAGKARLKLEVKSMNVTKPPKATNFNPVMAKNARQKADYYMFMRVQYKDRSNTKLGGRAYFCGAVPCQQLKAWSQFYRAGDIDSNGYRVRFTSYNTPIKRCLNWSTLADHLMEKIPENQEMALSHCTAQGPLHKRQRTGPSEVASTRTLLNISPCSKPPGLLVFKC